MDPSIGICEKNAMLAHGVTAKGSMYTHGDYFQLNEQQAFRVEAAAAADGKYILLGKKLDVCHHMNHVITKWTPPNSKGALWVLPLEKSFAQNVSVTTVWKKMNPKISFLYSFADARGKKDCKLHEHPARPKIYENIVKQVSIVIT
jgi:hypothetical protein